MCRICRAATVTDRSIRRNERETTESEGDDGECEHPARGRGMSVDQNQLDSQDSVSFHYLKHAGFLLQLPRSEQSRLFRHAECFGHLLLHQRDLIDRQ